MSVVPARDASAASWLLDADVPWMQLVRFGPPGFEACVRVAFEEPSNVARTLAVLARFTTTPDVAWAAVWEGWCGRSGPSAPVVPVPHRTMRLFTAPVAELATAPSVAWGAPESEGTPPHLAWPDDRAWCLACDVDEEIEYSVGCSAPAAAALEETLPGVVRRASYGEPAQLYLDED